MMINLPPRVEAISLLSILLLLPVILIRYFISAIRRTNFSQPFMFWISSRNKYGLLVEPDISRPISKIVFRSVTLVSKRRSSSKFTYTICERGTPFDSSCFICWYIKYDLPVLLIPTKQ